MSVRVVLVPGLGLDGRSSAVLRQRMDADVVLLPGMGRRGPVPPLEDLAAELGRALGEGPVLLVGHSQSCQIVVATAQRDPRVVGVVLLGPTTDPRLRSLRHLVARWLATSLGEPVRQAPRVLRQWLHTGPRAMRALWRIAAPDPITARLATLGLPVVVVRGSRDRLCDADWAARVAAAAPRGSLVQIPRAAHMTVQTHVDEVVAVLRAAAERAARG